MFAKFSDWLTVLGVTRDDQKWAWMKVLAVAAMVTSGALDMSSVANYLGLHPSETLLHWVVAVSTVVLYFAGQLSTSPLFAAPNKRVDNG